MSTKKLCIVSIASEIAPFSKTGGLGDVANSLPNALTGLGHKVISITPLYSTISPEKFGLKKIISDFAIKIDKTATVKIHVWKGKLNGDEEIYFIDYPKYFSRLRKIYGYEYDNQRFFLFNLAALKILKHLKITPDIIQCHDWHSGMIPWLVKKRFTKTFKNTSTVFTIHNLNFQMGMPWYKVPPRFKESGAAKLPLWKSKKWKYINFAKRGIKYADAINAVSEQYAKEILTEEFGSALAALLGRREKALFGIDNGIDYNTYNPLTDPGLVSNYDAFSLKNKQKNKSALQKKYGLPQQPNTPILGIVSRLTEQKGFDLLFYIFEPLMRMKIQLVVMGAGSPKYIEFFKKLTKKYPKKVAVHLEFNEVDATKVYAGSDMFLMPSRFEPCGLGQLISLRYGSVPIVRSVGGLASTVTDFNLGKRTGNGFVFHSYDARDFLIAIARATEVYRDKHVWRELVQNGMQESFSWAVPAKLYVQLFRRAIRNHSKAA